MLSIKINVRNENIIEISNKATVPFIQGEKNVANPECLTGSQVKQSSIQFTVAAPL